MPFVFTAVVFAVTIFGLGIAVVFAAGFFAVVLVRGDGAFCALAGAFNDVRGVAFLAGAFAFVAAFFAAGFFTAVVFFVIFAVFAISHSLKSSLLHYR
jgi:hypothetical protein